jgi:hypothetical protein
MYKVPTRDKEFGVGKRMGDNLYFHISYAEEIIGKRRFAKAKKLAEKAFAKKWFDVGGTLDIGSPEEGIQVIKYNKKMNKVSFMFCCDFNRELEPGVTGYICVDLNTESASMRSYKADYPIYHHTWLMVRDDYEGFSEFTMELSKKRSEYIEKLINSDLFSLDTSRIGMYSYWECNAIPILSKMKGWRELIVDMINSWN